MSTTLTERYGSWRERNPLRRWRLLTFTPMQSVAVVLGVSLTTIKNWEGGSTTPSDETLVRLAELTGDVGLLAEWAQWASEALVSEADKS